MAQPMEPVEDEGTSVLRRVRAVVLLVGLVVILGALVAGTLGLVVVGLASFMDSALE